MFSAEPTLEAPPRWGRRMPFVCLFDVENPLLDNDRVTEDLGIIGKGDRLTVLSTSRCN